MKKKLAAIILGIVCLMTLLTAQIAMAAPGTGVTGECIYTLAEDCYNYTQLPRTRCVLPPIKVPPYK